MPAQLQHVELITDKTNAADLSSGVFAIRNLISVTRTKNTKFNLISDTRTKNTKFIAISEI